jgi:hypothetical protein
MFCALMMQFRLVFSDAHRISPCRGDWLDVAYEPAGVRGQVRRAGDWQLGPSDRRAELTPEFLTETWGMMNRRAASGIDGESTVG